MNRCCRLGFHERAALETMTADGTIVCRGHRKLRADVGAVPLGGCVKGNRNEELAGHN
jgi:hypothetical protein